MWLDTVFNLTALIGGTVLIFQFVLMLLGLGGDGDLAADGADLSGGIDAGGVDVGGMEAGGTGDAAWHEAADADLGHPGAHWFYEVISLRTLSAAVTFFGLAGITARAYSQPATISFAIATLAGVAATFAVYWLFKQVYKLQHTGTENIRNALGLSATVYVPIPAKRGGAGKVTFRLQNRVAEYLAVTDEEDRLKTGEKVIVVGIVNSDTVRVSRAEKHAANVAAPITNVGSSV
ncbi:MAG TPA: hypothetical protein VJ828_18625 [Lacipirellulaceae bacterium]|nr:hypothetical protein [Lacipirellulaceae bacterium]